MLFSAFANCDYELAYVAAHSARSMALPYRLAALWGGQAGSLLLWLFILSVYASACVALQRRQNRTLMPWVVVVLLANATFFLVLLCFVTDPFERAAPRRRALRRRGPQSAAAAPGDDDPPA